ncbi:site-specific DNA-methyltransferase [Prevotella communis]|uniref:site-specific DNA-methyltransferase n=1 Tax=Prevotella communis TaxID=2913614 RepID=UPI001EDC51F4|nr:site-specific DNA-methyltransferase [Prevotella communis]UKK57818.1 site-specific DNA-methyltransferase [Prevotella communis]
MSVISDLIEKVNDPDLRARLSEEVARMQKQKKFGLVFEEHLPEATPLYDAAISVGSLVSLKDKEFKDFFRVKQINGDTLICEREDDSRERVELNKSEAVAVAMFGQPIYPCLKSMDAVKNAPDSDLWHTLIEADNYHALQLLVYLYGGMVDCIYIDPPYNTGDKSWKYNNNYVDSSDSFRHSKWLSMMKKRLVLAKKLLNPKDSVLIVTIDEKEYIHLGSLLEDMFPEANIQMISILIAQKGVARGNSFYRVNEYIYFVQLGESSVHPLDLNEQWALGKNDSAAAKGIVWSQLRRSGTNDLRTDRPNLFYPIIFNSEGTRIISTGNALASEEHPSSALEHKDGELWLWPIKEDGTEGNWQLSNIQVKDRHSKGYIKIGKIKENTIPLSYLKRGSINKIENEEVKLLGYDEKSGTVIVDASEYSREFVPGSQWNIETHDATYHGTQLLNKIIGKRFSFPKSLYAVHDTIRFFVANKPNALIVDFFAGSGTTLHAVNLLNAEDGGNRRCVMVTNNEVSAEEETKLKRAGYHPGQDEWEKWGIARYVNWPRTKCSILGVDVNNSPINGTYQTYLKQEKEKERAIKQITLIDNPSAMKSAQKKELVALCCQGKLPQSLVKADSKFIVSEDHPCTILFDINYTEKWLKALEDQDQVAEIYIVTRNNEAYKKAKAAVQELLGNIIEEEPVLRPMSNGFAANAQFFKLSFLDKNAVAMDMQFKELLTTLWMKAGAVGECPVIESNEIDDYYIFPDNKMAILKEEDAYMQFKEAMKGHNEIQTLFIITDSDSDFREMSADFEGKRCYQLYRDYLDNFSINYERN